MSTTDATADGPPVPLVDEAAALAEVHRLPVEIAGDRAYGSRMLAFVYLARIALTMTGLSARAQVVVRRDLDFLVLEASRAVPRPDLVRALSDDAARVIEQSLPIGVRGSLWAARP